MTELDFDELDKAVNNLMADVEKTADNPEPSANSSPVASLATELTAKPAPATTEPVPAKPSNSPLATKRRGQFMDVIRPSSSTAAKPTNLGRHQGVTLAPVASTSAVETPATPDTSESTVEDTTVTNVATESKSEWPDPIDLAGEDKESTGPSDTSAAESSTEAADAPLESPFLPDAKPEKRPLGGLQPDTDAVAPLVDESEKSASDSTSEQVTPPTPAMPLPEELHTNLVAIESESTAAVASVATEPSAATPEATPKTEATPVVATADASVSQPEPEVPAGGAITQQYKEAPSSGDQTNGSIYDTANYHKAIEAHATGGKKHSALKWIMWTILLVILGVGGGAAAFMLTR